MIGAMLSPRTAEMRAARAPSVARMGVMTPTLPIRKASAENTSPVTLPTPAASIQATFGPLRALGTPETARKGRVSRRPTSIAQATTDQELMSFTALEESSELLAKKTAVPSPHRMLITR